jgi:predicted alpha/beta-fold hydrolase
MTVYEVVFFLVHCLLHVFGYWVPCALGACADLLRCRPCRTCEKKKHGFAYHPAREVRLIHHRELTEAAVNVFGLMVACTSALEDRQYCTLAVARTHTDTHGGECRLSRAPGSGEATCETLMTAKPSATPDTAAQASGEVVLSSRSPLEPSLSPSPQADFADRYISQRYPHLSSSASPPRTATAARQATVAAPTTPAPSAPTAAPKSQHRPTYASPDKATRKEIKRCHLRYNAPLYGPHIGTIMGAFRQRHPLPCIREEMRAWDGCYLAMDWCYVDGEAPTAYDHAHTSRERNAGMDVAGHPNRPGGKAVNEPFSRAQDGAALASSSTGRVARQGGSSNRNSGSTHDHDEDRDEDEHGGDGPATGLSQAAQQHQMGTTTAATVCKNEARAPYNTLHASLKANGQGGGGCGNSSNNNRSANVDSPPQMGEVPVKEATGKAAGVVFIVPGLTSHAQSNYVQHLVRALHKANLHVCVLTTRGMGDSPPVTTPFLFNGAYTRDVRDCLQHFFTKEALATRFGRALPLVGIGLSIGGIILSKYVGEEGIAGADPHLDALICCCAPMDYVMTVEHMNRNGAQRSIYQADMCNSIRSYLLRYEPLQHLPNVDNKWLFEQGNVYRFRRVVHFDEHVIAKSAGYRSAHHYHIDASAVTWLPYAPIPVLALSAADDPIIGHTVMPHRWHEMVRNNPRLVYVEPPAGGHLGFLGNPWSELMDRENWMEVFVRDRVLAACNYWRTVQRRAQAERDGGAGRSAAPVTALPQSSASPSVLFSPTTAAVAGEAVATSFAVTQEVSWRLMKVVPVTHSCTRAGGGGEVVSSPITVAARRSTSGASHAVDYSRCVEGKSSQPAEVSVFTEGADAVTHGEAAVVSATAGEQRDKDVDHNRHAAAASSTPPYAATPKGHLHNDAAGIGSAGATHEPVLNASAAPLPTATSHSPHSTTENKPENSLAGRGAGTSFAAAAAPRPIQYMPPREDRPTNRCYFTCYCTPAVPEDRLRQPYFTAPRRATFASATAASAFASAAFDEGDRGDNDDNVSTSTTTAGGDDGRSSMYDTCSTGGNGRRRSLIICDDDGNTGVRTMGKDPRCMMVTGQYTYAPVVVNCDYTGDLRAMMQDD